MNRIKGSSIVLFKCLINSDRDDVLHCSTAPGHNQQRGAAVGASLHLRHLPHSAPTRFIHLSRALPTETGQGAHVSSYHHFTAIHPTRSPRYDCAYTTRRSRHETIPCFTVLAHLFGNSLRSSSTRTSRYHGRP